MNKAFSFQGQTYPMRAWTGGQPPSSGNLTPRTRDAFEHIRASLYREQWADYVAYWHDAPGPDVRSTFWTRASYDAWETVISHTGPAVRLR